MWFFYAIGESTDSLRTLSLVLVHILVFARIFLNVVSVNKVQFRSASITEIVVDAFVVAVGFSGGGSEHSDEHEQQGAENENSVLQAFVVGEVQEGADGDSSDGEGPDKSDVPLMNCENIGSSNVENDIQVSVLAQEEETCQDEYGSRGEDVETDGRLRAGEGVEGHDGVASNTDVDEGKEVQPGILVRKVALEVIQEAKLVEHFEVAPQLGLSEFVNDEENHESEGHKQVQDEETSVGEVV